MSMSINSTILNVTRRTKNGFTVGEIYDRVRNQYASRLEDAPLYSSVRAQVYRLAQAGQLNRKGVRRDSLSGAEATTFVRNN